MNRNSDIIKAILLIGITLVVGFLGSFFFTKIDLTEEKRHTLTESTAEMLGSLDDQMLIRVYLHGEFPANFKRLEQSIREKLDEFRDYSNGNLNYEFVDAYESGDKTTIQEIEERIYEEGLRPTSLQERENGAISEYRVWPGALISYKGAVHPVQLLKSDNPAPTDEMINSSVNNLEYELASSIRKVRRKEVGSIAFLMGQGELDRLELSDLGRSLDEQYDVSFVELEGQLNALTSKTEGVNDRRIMYDLLMIASPKSSFSNRDKIILDQYLMHGGKVIWMIDPIDFSLDSLAANQFTMGTYRDFGISDMLFEYGVRLNRTLVLDRSCGLIDLSGGNVGNQSDIQLYPWYFNPLIIPSDTAHPIVANLDPISLDFASSIDTVNPNPNIRKTPLLKSSYYSKALKAPVRIDPGIVSINPDFGNENIPGQIMGILLEGTFNSAYSDRINDTLRTSADFSFRDKSRFTKMIVIADGDIVKNKLIPTKDGMKPRALGYDRYVGRVIYDNKDFMLNAVNYMLDDESLIRVRSRTIKLRKLNEELIINDKGRWQIINTAIPLVVIVIFGLVQWYFRKNKYGQSNTAA